MNFSIIYKPSQASFINANLALMRSRLVFRIVAVVVLLMTIASIVSFFVFTKNHSKNISPIFLLVYVAIVCAVIYIRLRRRYTGFPAMAQLKEYTFTDKGIHIKGGSFAADIGWPQVTKVYTTRKFLFLFFNKAEVLYMPKEDITPARLLAIEAKITTKA